MNNNVSFLESERLYLRPLEDDDIELLYNWFNDQEVTYYLETGQLPLTRQQIKDKMDNEIKSGQSIILMIVDNDKLETIGIIGLYGLNHVARRAEMRIIIGNKNYWKKGYGSEALELITFYGFDRLNLNKIYLGVSNGNEGAKKAYLKAGYIEEGILKQDVYRNGQYYDGINMAMLREEYLQSRYQDHRQRFTKK